MRVKAMYRLNGTPFKLLSRILWHPAFQEGFPVRFRVASNVTKPAVRFNWHWLDVWLPPEYGRHIRLLSRLVRQWRNGNLKPCKTPTKPKRVRPKLQPLTEPNNGAQPKSMRQLKRSTVTAKPAKPKTCTKPKPAWQREWDALWDRVALALFGNRETRDDT